MYYVGCLFGEIINQFYLYGLRLMVAVFLRIPKDRLGLQMDHATLLTCIADVNLVNFTQPPSMCIYIYAVCNLCATSFQALNVNLNQT